MDLTNRHPGVTELLGFFDDDHLPAHLKPYTGACRGLAYAMVEDLPDGAELTFGLRQLLLAKDAFVRQAVKKHKADG